MTPISKGLAIAEEKPKMSAKSRENAEHYLWGDACDGWRLVDGPGLSVIEERMPAGASEVMHFHRRAEQFFYVLSGAAEMLLGNESVLFEGGQGLSVLPGVPHRIRNVGPGDLRFLVISQPTTRGDRVVGVEAEGDRSA